MYDHLKHSGNMFDIFKHACLIKAVEINYPGIYFESHCGFASYNKPELWDSSWMKVNRLTDCDCVLCDTNVEVEKSIPDSDKFQFYLTDGFKEVKERVVDKSNEDLYFIDPPYVDISDWENVDNLIQILIEYDRNWIVWYPIFKRTRDCFKSDHFKHLPVTTMEMYWQSDSDLYGCGMVFGGFPKADIKHIAKGIPFLSYCLSSTARIHYENI